MRHPDLLKGHKKCERVLQGHKIQGRRCGRWRNNCRRPNMRWSYDYEWVVKIIVKLVSWLCFGVGYRIIIWCLRLVGGLVVWTLWWWVAMRCHLIMPIWFNLFQIDSSTLTIWNSYAWQVRKLSLHFYDGQFRLTAHNCKTSACLS
jgi:hypothetical protein